MRRHFNKLKTSREIIDRGLAAEHRFVEVMNDKFFWPKWFMGARSANFREDYLEKTDAVLKTTEFGDIRVQIKSGRSRNVKGKESFFYKGIILLIIRQEDTDTAIRGRCMEILWRMIERIKKGEQKIEYIEEESFNSLGNVFG